METPDITSGIEAGLREPTEPQIDYTGEAIRAIYYARECLARSRQQKSTDISAASNAIDLLTVTSFIVEGTRHPRSSL